MYDVYLQPTARRQLRKLRRQKARLNAIDIVMEKLKLNPRSDDSIRLIDPDFHGFRRMRTDIDRIIYQICEDCRSDLSVQRLRQCIDCDDIPEKGVKVFEIIVRREAYKKR